MPGPRDTTRVTERRLEVARRYLQGEHQAVIAKDLHVSQCLISKDLTALRAEWLARAVRDIETLTAEQLMKVDTVEHEALSAWARSQREGRVGDPRYLELVLKCVERRSYLMGLNAPQKFQVDWSSLSEHQLELLAAGHPLPAVLSEALPAPMAEA